MSGTGIVAQDSNGYPDTFHFPKHSQSCNFMTSSCCSRHPVCSKQREYWEEKGKESGRDAKLSQSPPPTVFRTAVP